MRWCSLSFDLQRALLFMYCWEEYMKNSSPLLEEWGICGLLSHIWARLSSSLTPAILDYLSTGEDLWLLSLGPIHLLPHQNSYSGPCFSLLVLPCCMCVSLSVAFLVHGHNPGCTLPRAGVRSICEGSSLSTRAEMLCPRCQGCHGEKKDPWLVALMILGRLKIGNKQILKHYNLLICMSTLLNLTPPHT